MNDVMADTVCEPQPPVGHRYLLPFAPPVPPGFYGKIQYTFEAGKLVSALVEERLKP